MIQRGLLIGAGFVIGALGLALGVQTVRLSFEQADHATTKRLHAEALASAEIAARKTETALRADLDVIQADAAKEKEIAKAREDALVESVRSGQRRLSIAAQCPSAASSDTSASTGRRPSVSRAELDPQVGVDLIAIARDGDEAIRERNACVSAYNDVRMRVSGGGSASR